MSLRYLLDTNVLSEPMRPVPDAARLARKGSAPPFVDGQIASIAVVNRLTLVTRNVRDFAPFAGLDVESWFGGG